jgi:hypothetical protein
MLSDYIAMGRSLPQPRKTRCSRRSRREGDSRAGPETGPCDLVEVLEELRDVLVQIDIQTVDRRYVDFAALAERLEECIEKVQELPAA